MLCYEDRQREKVERPRGYCRVIVEIELKGEATRISRQIESGDERRIGPRS